MDRLRRIGWLLLGDDVTVDLVLAALVMTTAGRPGDTTFSAVSTDSEVLSLAVTAFEDICRHAEGSRALPLRSEDRPPLEVWLHNLPFLDRAALVLLEVEGIDDLKAARILGRPVVLLHDAVGRALDTLPANA